MAHYGYLLLFGKHLVTVTVTLYILGSLYLDFKLGYTLDTWEVGPILLSGSLL